MVPIVKHLTMTQDCEKGDEYVLFESPEPDDEHQIVILVRENDRNKVRTVEAVFVHKDRAVVDQWCADVETICAEFRPPEISFLQFVTKVAVAVNLLPEDHEDLEDAKTPWAPDILRALVKGLEQDFVN